MLKNVNSRVIMKVADADKMTRDLTSKWERVRARSRENELNALICAQNRSNRSFGRGGDAVSKATTGCPT